LFPHKNINHCFQNKKTIFKLVEKGRKGLHIYFFYEGREREHKTIFKLVENDKKIFARRVKKKRREQNYYIFIDLF
jgi:hypothetical protein